MIPNPEVGTPRGFHIQRCKGRGYVIFNTQLAINNSSKILLVCGSWFILDSSSGYACTVIAYSMVAG